LRFAGYRESLARHNLSRNNPRLLAGDPTDASFIRKAINSSELDAVICSNDLTAALLMQTLSGTFKLSLPGDLAVAAFDDVNYSTLLSVPLTTMRQPCSAIARGAVDAILARIREPYLPTRQILFAADLVIRKSSGQ
jgi:LacI family transcriptional regulator